MIYKPSKYPAVIYLFCLLLLGSCGRNSLENEYHDLGRFSHRVEAEQKALAYWSSQYATLPDKDFKVKFAHDVDATPGFIWNTDAIWYNKQTKQLAFEHDLYSGKSCGWEGVDQMILAQVVTANKGLVMADSLAKPSFGSYAKSITF